MPDSGTKGVILEKLEHKSLDRGITVMETLARNGSCTLADIHKLTLISKSSIRRLLATLIARRLVWKSLADGKYRINVIFPVNASEPVPTEQAFVLDVALPHMTELTKSISWPSDIHLIDGDRMRILDSTRPLSPFHLYRGVVNRHINIFGSATGMVCLANMKDSEFIKIAAHTQEDMKWGLERFRLNVDDYRGHLETSRGRGFGARISRYIGETVFDDGLAAIATPIFCNNKLFGAVSLLWPKNYLKVEEFAAEYFEHLQATTKNISLDLEELQTTTP